MRFLFTLILFALAGSVTAQTTEQAHAYMQTIGNQFYQISNDRMSYTSAASHGKSARKVEKKRTELINTIKMAEANIRKMKPFNGSAAYRDSVVAYLKLNRIVLTEDYGKILDMEEIAEQSYDAMEGYMLAKEKAEEKLDVAFEKVSEQQKLFASNNNIKLVESDSKLSEKLETSGKVFTYYNPVYLIFFKSYKDEMYMLDAIGRNDINAMEQTKNALLANVEKGTAVLGPMAAYKGDNSLKVACQQLLSFYKMEASQKMSEIINFQLKQDNYEKMKAAMEAKRPADRTKQDVDEFNKMVNDYNVSVGKINALQNELNKKRTEALNRWNEATENFLDKHIPKYRG
jgi:hypothetical protein